ncbi:protein ATP6V1FNB [Hemicordylus capensis]|uniref:protein ATP6V1FNB n=1 Tax=Hemicordylus capensis TaxID=884348 RepID=UPI0023037645|nr:protein ATP6V1FNB [Hemicordylus capensis]
MFPWTPEAGSVNLHQAHKNHHADSSPLSRAMRDLLTTREQDGWRELISKEAACRVGWKAKYGQKYPRQLPNYGISRRKGFLPALCLPEAGLGSPKCPEQTAQREEGQQLLGEKEVTSHQEPLPEMRVPTPEITQLLYQGFSHEGKGRSHYLKERKMKSPEEKFCYPVLSSWEYGWRLGDVVKDIRTPIYGKSRIVKDTFFFKNGIFYHPSKTDKLS